MGNHAGRSITIDETSLAFGLYVHDDTLCA